ncbi:methylmalonyl-CoA mutase, partial [bacterium]|nr:methylmalonyl-CoA mutase [bacterium]MBU1024888.1 methylmalonyl-CoA mutase [bacterium]
NFKSTSGFPVEPLYAGSEVRSEDEYPGFYPFTRGIHGPMYRTRHWTMRQYAGFGSAEDTNNRYRFLLEKGQTGLSVAFDLPTQVGIDSDDAMSLGEVGKTGVAIDTLEDMRVLFNQIPLGDVSTSMTINAPATVILAMYIAVADESGVPRESLRGTVQNDILKEYIARGTYIFPPEPSLYLIADTFRFLTRELPTWNSISISGYHIREAGSTAVQELAFTFANGIEYVKAAIAADLDIDTFGERLSFFFNAHNDLLEEVAKFRAARRIWARIMREKFGSTNPKTWMLRFHTQTAGSMLTSQYPDNNIVRVAMQALAAVLGGTQSLHTNSKDEALALPSEGAAHTALSTQQVLAYESGVTHTADPLAGSYYVEAMTDKIEELTWEYLDKIEEQGGALKSIERGYPQMEIQKSAFEWQREVENKERIIVGVNKFRPDTVDETWEILRVDEQVERNQVEKLRKWKEDRDSDAVNNTLKKVRKVAEERGEIFEAIIEAVKAKATLGELTGVMKEVFGEYRENVVL